MIEDMTTKVDLRKDPMTNSYERGGGGSVEDMTTSVDLRKTPITMSYERGGGKVEDMMTEAPLKQTPVRGWSGPGGAFPAKSPDR